MNLNQIIEELENLLMTSTPRPWTVGSVVEDDCGYNIHSIGPGREEEDVCAEDEDIQGVDDEKYPIEETIAEFYEINNSPTNAKLAVFAVNTAPLLIERIKELEQTSSTELSDDVERALKALEKWRKNPQSS